MFHTFVRTHIVALVALLGLGFALAGTVRAHSELVDSTPADGATLDAAPETVVARFSGELAADGSSLVVTDANGNVVDQGDSALDTSDAQRTTLVVSLQPDLGSGTYTVEWSAEATDGHTETGSFTFTVAAEAEATPSPDASPDATPEMSPEASPSPAASLPDTAGSDRAWTGVALFVAMLIVAGVVIRGFVTGAGVR